MKTAFGFLPVLLLATVAIAQPSAPVISQVFAFWCNGGYTSCPYGFDPALTPVQLIDGNLYTTTWWAGQGSSNNGGTDVRVSRSGQALVLHTFTQAANGQFPLGEN